MNERQQSDRERVRNARNKVKNLEMLGFPHSAEKARAALRHEIRAAIKHGASTQDIVLWIA